MCNLEMHRKELENKFAQRIREVDGYFSGHQEEELKRCKTDVCNVKQHYQSKVAALAQCHAADRMQWKAELEFFNQEAEQQRNLLQEALQLEKETIVTERSHSEDIVALMERNLQLQSELENIFSSVQTKETEFTQELIELGHRLQVKQKDKGLLLIQTENKAVKLKLLFRPAIDDLARERVKFQNHPFELERQHAETLSFVEKPQQGRSDLVREQKEPRWKVEEMEHHLHQAVEDFHDKCLEIQGTVAELEEKLKNSVFIATGNQFVQVLSLPDLSIELKPQDLSAENFIIINIHNGVIVGFGALGENSQTLQYEELKRQLSLQDKLAGVFENPEPVNEQVLKMITFSGANKTDKTEKVKDDCFTDDVDVPKSIAKDSTSFAFNNSGVISTKEIIELGTNNRIEDSSVGTRSFTEDTNSLVEELCENSAEARNKLVAFGIINTEAEHLKPKGAEICNSIYSEIADTDLVNNAERDECTQNMKLNICAFAKDVVEKVDEEVAMWRSDEFDPVEELVKNGTFCISAEIVQMDANRARDAKIEDDTTSTAKTDDNSTTSSQHQILALEGGPMLKKEQEETAISADLCALEILELRAIAVQIKYQSNILELLHEQYRSAVKQSISLQDQMANQQQLSVKLELLLDLNRVMLLTSQKVLEKNYNLRMALIARTCHAKELEMKTLELAAIQAHYEKCICKNMQLAEQKVKLERKVQQPKSKMDIVQEFQEQQSSLLESMYKGNVRLGTAPHNLERGGKVPLTMRKEVESISVDFLDDSYQDHGFQLGRKITTGWQLKDCCLESRKLNSCPQSAVTHLQEKSRRINRKIQEHGYHKIPISSCPIRREIPPKACWSVAPASCSVFVALAPLCPAFTAEVVPPLTPIKFRVELEMPFTLCV